MFNVSLQLFLQTNSPFKKKRTMQSAPIWTLHLPKWQASNSFLINSFRSRTLYDHFNYPNSILRKYYFLSIVFIRKFTLQIQPLKNLNKISPPNTHWNFHQKKNTFCILTFCSHTNFFCNEKHCIKLFSWCKKAKRFFS
jgi:hypothetical protein